MFKMNQNHFGLRCLICVKLIFLCNVVCSLPIFNNKSSLLDASRSFLQEEDSLSIGYGVELSAEEKLVDSLILAPMKADEYLNVDLFSNTSDLFQFIRKMPKGGDLHVHDISMVNVHWVVSELTYLPNLYYCDVSGGKFLRYRYSDHVPDQEDFCDDAWISVQESREEMGAEEFDEMLYNKMTMDNIHDNAQSAWEEFFGSIDGVTDLMYSETGFRPYFKQALTELYEDNVLYVEVRTLLPPIMRNNGSLSSREETLKWFIEVTNEFKEQNPDFIGAKFISISVRSMPSDSIEADIRTTMDLRQKYPTHLAGYDLVGYENDGPPLSALLDILFIPAENGVDLPFFFHSGETKQFGETDENILFAILLNTTRIGHGYALTKHPLLMEMVNESQIPIEVNPISNQVLNLVSDMRNHAAAVFFANGLPVVICSDDPAPWKASGLTYDYRAAFMAFTKEEDGLAVLKEISGNAIKYSAMSKSEKDDALIVWERKWNEFINSFSVSTTVAMLGAEDFDPEK